MSVEDIILTNQALQRRRIPDKTVADQRYPENVNVTDSFNGKGGVLRSDVGDADLYRSGRKCSREAIHDLLNAPDAGPV
jgi:hypothetical protein